MDCYKSFRIKPEIQVSDNAFRIVLPNVNRPDNDYELSEKESIVMNLFDRRTSISRKDVEVALAVSQTMAGRILKQLVQKDKIASKGAGSNHEYYLWLL